MLQATEFLWALTSQNKKQKKNIWRLFIAEQLKKINNIFRRWKQFSISKFEVKTEDHFFYLESADCFQLQIWKNVK